MQDEDPGLRKTTWALSIIFAVVVGLNWYIWKAEWDSAIKEVGVLIISTIANLFLVVLLVLFNRSIVVLNRRVAIANERMSDATAALRQLAEEERAHRKADFVIDLPTQDPRGRAIKFLQVDRVDFEITNRGWMDSAIWKAQLESWGDGAPPTIRDLHVFGVTGHGDDLMVRSGERRMFYGAIAGRIDPAREKHHILRVAPAIGPTATREFA